MPRSPKRAPRASVLYSDDPYFGPGGLFLAGELDSADCDRIREIVLHWRGVAAELRPRERKAFGAQLDRALEQLTAASKALDELSSAMADAADERHAERRAEEGDDA